MSATIIIEIGIGMIGLSGLLFLTNVVYGRTIGKKIREELKKDYE